MIYTIDNPKLVTYYNNFRGIKNFTGVVKDKENIIAYYLNGDFHREDGPALQWGGDHRWYLNGKLHREGGPAVDCIGRRKEWWLHGKCHREDGPAVEWAHGEKMWYFNNEFFGNNDFTNESWIKFVKLQLLK